MEPLAQIARLDSQDADFSERLARLLAYEATQDAQIELAVQEILVDVRERGDQALLEYTRRFDRLDVADAAALELSRDEQLTALGELDSGSRDALQSAAQRVRSFHERQRAESWSYTEPDGTRLGQRVTALDRVGLYVPGGKASYPSSVLMNAIPAKVAGVAELIMVVPTPDGVRNP
ncbi:MAG: histidinol dehydrogenase, partial [Quisquiliibacterium sp.]